MSQDLKKIAKSTVALEFKTSTFSVPVLMLTTDDFKLLEQQLTQKIKQAPEFFKNSPLVIDLQEVNRQGYLIDVVALVGLIRKSGLLIVGIRGGNVAQNKQSLELGIPVYMAPGRDSETETKNQIKTSIETSPIPAPVKPEKIEVTVPTTIITQPVRSGQRIYAAGDLVIMAQVSAGAEIIAEGNIHVYSTLRGRALAGVQGDIEARIFCFDLQAELISIAGNYKVSEDLSAAVRNKPVQIYLQDKSLIIKDIV
ncbi:MAG: septum site-determining protein MinC [Methylococcales bacterium]|nr:septum site-determining protein MinC [Methylococcales bacterium]